MEKICEFMGISLGFKGDGDDIFATSAKHEGFFSIVTGAMTSGDFDAAGRTLIQEWILERTSDLKENLRRFKSGQPIKALEPLSLD